MNLLYEILVTAGYLARAFARNPLVDILLCLVGFAAFAAVLGGILTLL